MATGASDLRIVYTSVCQCSPARAAMLSGRFAPVNRVTRTFLWPGLAQKKIQPNIASGKAGSSLRLGLNGIT
jgi:hypothetical protein